MTAKKSRKEAGEYKSRYERKIKGVEEEADRILEEARKKALDKRKEIIAGAKKEEAVILAHAKKEAELEWKRVQDEMKKQMIEGSLLIASRMIAVSLDEEMHRKLIGETLKEMDEGICLSR